MKKRSLHIGINYTGSHASLNGCHNDAKDMQTFFVKKGFETNILLENEATKANIVTAIVKSKCDLSKNDVFVLTFSGHGTQIFDLSGDEKDTFDECICPYDFQNELITDDELCNLLNCDADVLMIADCCHSGTLHKIINMNDTNPNTRIKSMQVIDFQGILNKPKTVNPKFIAITGCTEMSYSYDTFFNNKANGALTANLLKIYTEGITISSWFTKLRKELPTKRYPQKPQLIGCMQLKNLKL